MKTAIYARRSTLKLGQSETISNQIKICRRRAKELGLTIVDVKQDSSTGVTDNNRDEVKELIRDSIEGKYECVIMKGISRFYRDVEHGLSLVKKLDRSGIRVITVEENFDSFERRTSTGQLDTSMLTMYLMFAENESKKLADRIKHTQIEKAHAGEWNQASSPPFGYYYNKEDKKLHIDITKSETVKMIFDMYLDGVGMRAISLYLNGQNDENRVYPSPRGKQWSQYTIGFILKNRVYIGDVVYNKRSKNARPYKNPVQMGKSEDDVYVGADYNPEKDWIIVPKAHEAIISDEVFFEAQKLIKSKGVRTGIRSNVSLLAKTAVCGKCGKGMTFKRGNKDKNGRINTKSNYYCSNYIKYGVVNCDSHHVGADELEELTITSLQNHIKQFVQYDKVTQGVRNKPNLNDNIASRINKLQDAINTLSHKTNVLLEKNISGTISDAQFSALNDSYVKEMENLTASLIDLKEQQSKLDSTEKTKDYLSKVYDKVMDIQNYPIEKQRYLIMDLIERIVVTDGNVEFEFKF